LRRSGLSPHDSEDMVQAFAGHLLAGNGLSTVCPEKGRFRTFLLVSLRNFQASKARLDNAQKRGGRTQLLSLDLSEAEDLAGPELADGLGLSPDKAYDRQWARRVMLRSLDRLELEYRQPKQQKVFQALKPMLLDAGRVNGESAVAGELGMTPGALAVAATRLRQRFRLLIEDEVAQTLGPGGDLPTELKALREAWL
jgi:RNA polymerase sigma-70 factor (ECF subfamily)